MKDALSGMVVILLVFSLSGCATSQGFGKDVQHLGAEIEDI